MCTQSKPSVRYSRPSTLEFLTGPSEKRPVERPFLCLQIQMLQRGISTAQHAPVHPFEKPTHAPYTHERHKNGTGPKLFSEKVSSYTMRTAERVFRNSGLQCLPPCNGCASTVEAQEMPKYYRRQSKLEQRRPGIIEGPPCRRDVTADILERHRILSLARYTVEYTVKTKGGAFRPSNHEPFKSH